MSRRQVGSALDHVYVHVSVARPSLDTRYVLKIILTVLSNSTIVSIGSAIQ